MKLLKSIDPRQPASELLRAGTAVTIGNFDGFHPGHQSLVSETLRLAKKLGCDSVAMSFEPHPAAFFSKRGTGKNIFSREQKIKALEKAGLDALLLQRFDEEFSGMTALSFWKDILLGALHCKALVVGQDFRYGFRREGDVRALAAEAKKHGILFSLVAPTCLDGKPVSSTRIRTALRAGEVSLAARLLGSPFVFEGKVVAGNRIGRTLGFPTMNLAFICQMLPANGVYACFLRLVDDKDPPLLDGPAPIPGYPAVMSIGNRDSFPELFKNLVVEVHVPGRQFDEQQTYGKKAQVSVIRFLRPCKKFHSPQALKEQIAADIRHGLTILAENSGQ